MTKFERIFDVLIAALRTSSDEPRLTPRCTGVSCLHNDRGIGVGMLGDFIKDKKI